MGDTFDKPVEIGKLAEQHQYDEHRRLYSADVRGWSPSYDFEGIESWLELIAAQNDPVSAIETVQHLVAETDDAFVTLGRGFGSIVRCIVIAAAAPATRILQ